MHPVKIHWQTKTRFHEMPPQTEWNSIVKRAIRPTVYVKNHFRPGTETLFGSHLLVVRCYSKSSRHPILFSRIQKTAFIHIDSPCCQKDHPDQENQLYPRHPEESN